MKRTKWIEDAFAYDREDGSTARYETIAEFFNSLEQSGHEILTAHFIPRERVIIVIAKVTIPDEEEAQ